MLPCLNAVFGRYMNIYRDITTAALTLLGCATAARSQFSNLLVPTKFMRGCQYNDMLIGIICSKVDHIQPAQGEERELFDQLLYCMEAIGPIDDLNESSLFARQNEILRDLKLNTDMMGKHDLLRALEPNTVMMGRNEALIRAAFSGKNLALNTMFDLLNVRQTFATYNTIQSYDRKKISDTLHYRAGYIDEYYQAFGTKYPLHHVPVLSDGKKAFSSPYFDFNDAPVGPCTTEVITVVSGFALTVQEFNDFANNLILLKNAQEEHALSTTVQMQIIAGYPACHTLKPGEEPEPSIMFEP